MKILNKEILIILISHKHIKLIKFKGLNNLIFIQK